MPGALETERSQRGNWAKQDELVPILLGHDAELIAQFLLTALREGCTEAKLAEIVAAQYLAAHSPTIRSQAQTYQIAVQLQRGDRLFVAAGKPRSTDFNMRRRGRSPNWSSCFSLGSRSPSSIPTRMRFHFWNVGDSD